MLLLRLAKGEVIQRKFTIVEGWSFRGLARRAVGRPQLEDEIGRLSDAEIMDKLGRAGVLPEGRFLPETYVYTRGTGELALLDRAAKAMDKALAEAWESRATELPLQVGRGGADPRLHRRKGNRRRPARGHRSPACSCAG